MKITQIRTKDGIQKTTKTGVHRTVQLNDRSRDALLKIREITGFKNEWVFLQSDGRPIITGDPQRKAWRASLRRLGFAYQDPYTVRHSYATLCLMQGLNPAFVCAQLGHSLEEFFKTYAKWIHSENDASEMAKLNAALPSFEINGAKTGRFGNLRNKVVENQGFIGAKGETRKK